MCVRVWACSKYTHFVEKTDERAPGVWVIWGFLECIPVAGMGVDGTFAHLSSQVTSVLPRVLGTLTHSLNHSLTHLSSSARCSILEW